MIRSLVLCLLVAAPFVRGDTLDSILTRMDQASVTFQGIKADLTMVTHETIVGDTVEHGTLQMQRKGKDVRAIMAFTGAGSERTLWFQKSSVTIYYPKTNGYQTVDLGKNAQVLNQLLLLGFGSSGKELSANYDIEAEGTEDVNGKPATKLQLIPKDPKVKEKLSKVEIWVPNGEAYPVQQLFYQPNGDSRKTTYTNIVLNPPVAGKLEYKLPAGAKKI